MKPNQNSDIVPGWVGGFAESNPSFAYPTPDLTSLPMLGNMDNINLLQRQQAVEWPEFSWETRKGHSDPMRCFQQFASYISRVGYTNDGRVYSIICPQQGVCSPAFGSLNVEVSVTGQRGWVNETDRTLAADMTVEGKVWFGPSALENWEVKFLLGVFKFFKIPFPSDKANAIRITTHSPGNPDQPIFPVRKDETTLFRSPDFAQHPKAWAVGNIEVQIGSIIKWTGHQVVNDFNELVMDIFNMASGNMLQSGNILTWNLWFTAPQLVDQEEWRTHAERWRHSIDADHGSPDVNPENPDADTDIPDSDTKPNDGTAARYFDGTPFTPLKEHKNIEREKIADFKKKHFSTFPH